MTRPANQERAPGLDDYRVPVLRSLQAKEIKLALRAGRSWHKERMRPRRAARHRTNCLQAAARSEYFRILADLLEASGGTKVSDLALTARDAAWEQAKQSAMNALQR